MSPTPPRVAALATGLTAALATLGQAQIPERTLAGPDAAFPESFSLVRGVRELPDGRLLVADALGQVLVRLDLRAATADTIGKVGQGPNEYGQPDGVFPLPGDSTLLVDLGNARLTVIGPDGTFGRTMPISLGSPGAGPGSLSVVLPRAVDRQGHVYFQAMGAGAGGVPDSAPVVRWDRATDAMDTVAMVKLQDMERSTSGGAGNRSVMIRPRPLSPQDGWSVAPDGRVAVVRASDYHVEWIHRDGRRVQGPAVPYRPVPVRQTDKEQWVEALGNGLTVSMTIENGRPSMQMRRGGGGPARPEVDGYEWPEHKPAFDAADVWVAPEGELWVERSTPAGRPATFDVFGADGRLSQRITLPPDRRLVGFGRGVVYLVRVDELDLQWLERYRLTAAS
jgi:hypothetical protein